MWVDFPDDAAVDWYLFQVAEPGFSIDICVWCIAVPPQRCQRSMSDRYLASFASSASCWVSVSSNGCSASVALMVAVNAASVGDPQTLLISISAVNLVVLCL